MALRYVLFDLSLFEHGSDTAKARVDLTWLLQALCARDQQYLVDHPRTPLLYRSGVVYEVPAQFNGMCPEVQVLREAIGDRLTPQVEMALDTAQAVIGGERFRDIGRIIENGKGDCFPLTQKIIVRSKSTGQYELVELGHLRHLYSAYEALSYNFSKCEYEFKEIVGFIDKGVKAVSKARLSNGTDLVSTDDHKFWTLDGSGENSRRLGTRSMGEYVEATGMSLSRRKARSRIIQATKIPALNAVSKSPAEAYIAGIYAAEGCRSGSHTTIGQHKMPVRMKIEESLAELGVSSRYVSGHGKTPGSGAEYRLHGGPKSAVIAGLREQGLDSFDKRFPQEMLSADEATVSRMLEGHGDGDARRPANGAYKRPNIDAIYATSSDQLMEQIRLGLLITGRPTYTYRYEDHGGEGDSPLWRVHEYNKNASKLNARVALVGDELPGLTYGTVRNAAPFGKAHVACIEVEGNHNFFLADGTLVANCDNLGAWRAAELRQQGIAASPFITWRKRADGGVTYHVIVRWPDNTLEDPSMLLGMGGPARKEDRDQQIKYNLERAEMAAAAIKRGQPIASAFGAKHDRRVNSSPFRVGPLAPAGMPSSSDNSDDLSKLAEEFANGGFGE